MRRKEISSTQDVIFSAWFVFAIAMRQFAYRWIIYGTVRARRAKTFDLLSPRWRVLGVGFFTLNSTIECTYVYISDIVWLDWVLIVLYAAQNRCCSREQEPSGSIYRWRTSMILRLLYPGILAMPLFTRFGALLVKLRTCCLQCASTQFVFKATWRRDGVIYACWIECGYRKNTVCK